MRERERYIVFYVIAENNRKISQKEILNSIMHSVISLLGEVNAANAFLYLIEWDENRNFGILRTTNKFVNSVIFALSLISKINNCNVSFNTLKTSGTIKRAKNFLNSINYCNNQCQHRQNF